MILLLLQICVCFWAGFLTNFSFSLSWLLIYKNMFIIHRVSLFGKNIECNGFFYFRDTFPSSNNTLWLLTLIKVSGSKLDQVAPFERSKLKTFSTYTC